MDELTIRAEALDTFFSRAKASAARIDAGNVSPEPAGLSFATPAQLLEGLTVNRWNLVAMLRSTGPSSIRALSQAVGRDYRGVHADIARLLELGLVERRDDGKIVAPWAKITAELVFDVAT